MAECQCDLTLHPINAAHTRKAYLHRSEKDVMKQGTDEINLGFAITSG